MKRLKRVLGSVKNLTKDEFGGSTSSVLSRLTTTRSVASKSSLDNKNEFNKDGAYMGYDFQSSPVHGSHLIDYTDPLNYSDHSSTKLHKYCFLGDVGRVKKFLRKVNSNSQDSEGRTPLHLASASGQHEVVQILLAEKVNPEIEDYDGRSPFLIAVERNQIEIVHIFLKYKVNKLVKDKYGNQAIHLAARTGAKDVIDLLLDAGLDPNAINMLDQTPLHIATENLNIDVVKSLLSCEVNVNAIDGESVSALMVAAKTGSNLLVDLLLEAGVDIHLTDSSGWNATAYAKYSMHEELEHKLAVLTLSDGGDGRPAEQTQSLDRMPKKHIRSVSDSYDSWTNSSISESQKLKLTYFNAEAENSNSSKTLPRQRHSNSSHGPPKPPRLYTSTPNLDMNEQNMEENANIKEQMSHHRSGKHSAENKESSWDNTIKSDVSFDIDDSFMELSQRAMEDESVSEKKIRTAGKQVTARAPRSHSLSPDNWDSDTDMSVGRRAHCDIGSEFKVDQGSYTDGLSVGSNRDKLNEIEEVWESNAHLSIDSPPVRSHSFDSSKQMEAAKKDSNRNEKSHPNIRDDFLEDDVDSTFDDSLSTSSRNIYKNSVHDSASSHSSNDSAQMFERRKSDESNLRLLLSSTTPSGRDELQGLVRKLRSALNDVNISSKAKDHSLTTLKKSESFLKRQLKDVEKKTSELAEQNSDFMYRLEHLQSKTSALKDEAKSVCNSLEEKSQVKEKSHDNCKEIQESSATTKHSTMDLNYESQVDNAPLDNFTKLQIDNHTSGVSQFGSQSNPISENNLPTVYDSSSKLTETIESSVQTDWQSMLKAVQTQTDGDGPNKNDAFSREIHTNPGHIDDTSRNVQCCNEEVLGKMFNSAMEEWKNVFQDAYAKMSNSVDNYSARDQIINEVNDRLDYLNEQVPRYRDDVQAAVESSVCFNEDVFKRIKKIEDACDSAAALKTLPDILRTRDRNVESALSNIAQMKLELSASLDRLEASINSNSASAERNSQQTSDHLTDQIDSIYGKIASIEGNLGLMQTTLTEKVLTFSNVSDEIKEVSCGMRRISDSHGANGRSASGHFPHDDDRQDLVLETRFDKLENNLDGFAASLEMLKRDFSVKLDSFNGLASDSGKSLCLLGEIFDHMSALDVKLRTIVQNQEPDDNPTQLGSLQDMLSSNEKSVEDIKLSVQLIYNLLKTFEHQQLNKSNETVQYGNVKCDKNNITKESNNLFDVALEEASESIHSNGNDDGKEIDTPVNENRLPVAGNERLPNNPDNSHTEALWDQSQYDEWLVEKAVMQEEAKSLRKVNRELFGKLSTLETDCDELEEELELQNKEMQNQKKINSIQKKEIIDMRQQMALVVCLQNEKFSLEEQVIRFEHSELEFKHIIDQLQKKVLQLSRGNASSSVGLMGGHSGSFEADDSKFREGSDVIPTAQIATNDAAMNSLFANIDDHFQAMVGKKLKELNEMLVERVTQGPSAREPTSVEIYQSEMIKLQKEIISLRDEIERVDCDKELWNSRYDELHARYEQLQRQQPFSRGPEDEESSFKKILEHIEDQLKIPYPVSRIVESGHPDSDYFSSLRCSTNSGSSSFEPRSAERTFVSILRPSHSPSSRRTSPSIDPGHTLIPLFATARPENSSVGASYNTNVSGVDHSSERYMNFLQVKHSA